MGRKINKTADVSSSTALTVIPNDIGAVTIDHVSQLPSWTEAPGETDAELIAMIPEQIELARAEGAYDDLGPIVTVESDEAFLEQIEAQAAVLESQASEDVQQPEATVDEPSEPVAQFTDVIAAFTEEDITAKAQAIADAITDRGTFERTSNPDNANIHKTLAKVQSAFVTKAAARVMLATNTSEDFINRSVHEGKRYNVYALGKAADIMKAATAGVMSNAINIACMKSLFAMKGAGLPFTLETAKACASKQYPCDAAIRQHLIRHTVAPGTAPTQASSTMQALATLGVVTTSGSSKNPTFTLTSHPIVEQLREAIAA